VIGSFLEQLLGLILSDQYLIHTSARMILYVRISP
jgi:hypothetical protein